MAILGIWMTRMHFDRPLAKLADDDRPAELRYNLAVADRPQHRSADLYYQGLPIILKADQ
ncbi:hypothetical protein QT972_19080 [Microcoleus sp. herbarium7]|uniref:hypothetical protein n=1 Tax=Microcoleus sp. herbarium7 TaxID=3055435 RepID=UPI002FD509D3